MKRLQTWVCKLLLGGMAAWPSAVLADAPFLWMLRDGATTHYLQGSVHLLPESAHPLPAQLETAYDGAAELVFEADIDALSAPENQLALMNAARAAEGGLRAQLPAPLYARLQKRAQQIGLPLALCEPFKPWFCALSLEVFAYQQAGFTPELGLDQHFYRRAQRDGKGVGALESADAHLSLLATMPEALSRQLLEQALDGAAVAAPEPLALYQSWRANDLGALQQLVADMRRDYPKIHERLLAARNRAWLPKLTKRLRSGQPQLVIVGAAHLVGDEGLIELLADEGLILQPLAPPAESP